MAKKFFEEKRPHNGMTYNEYIKEWEKYLSENNPDNLEPKEQKQYEYKKMNLHRTKRIHKTYDTGSEFKKVITDISQKQLWMVLTENWCGDSAQTLPYIAIAAEENPDIELRILSRDDNPDIMDHYLTNGGSRSIPKLVAFDENGNELFQWGPRPQEAQKFVKTELSKGREKSDVYKDLHLWYGRNRGKEIEKEFIEILSES